MSINGIINISREKLYLNWELNPGTLNSLKSSGICGCILGSQKHFKERFQAVPMLESGWYDGLHANLES